jgi:hypothetical protein
MEGKDVGGKTMGAGNAGREIAGGRVRSRARVHARSKPLADWNGPQAQIGTELH